MMANFAHFWISNFKFFSWQIILDEILISVKFQDEHRHGSGDIRKWKWWFLVRVYCIRKNTWLKFTYSSLWEYFLSNGSSTIHCSEQCSSLVALFGPIPKATLSILPLPLAARRRPRRRSRAWRCVSAASYLRKSTLRHKKIVIKITFTK